MTQLIIQSPVSKPTKLRGRLQYELAAPVYFNGFCPFLDWMKVSEFSGMNSTTTGSLGNGFDKEKTAVEAGYVNPDTLELMNPCPSDIDFWGRLFLSTVDDRFDGEQFKFTWDGTGTPLLPGGGTGKVIDAQTANSVTVTFGTGVVGTAGIAFSGIDPNDPPRNIKVFQTRYENETVIDGITYPGINQGGIFNPHWLHAIRDAGCFRLMDWLLTNNSPAENFSDFAPYDAITWAQIRNGTLGGVAATSWGGIPLQVIADLVEATGVPEIWVNIPHRATDASVQAFAEFFRDHPAFANCVVCYEYSNEVWNFLFEQALYSGQQAEGIWPGDSRGWVLYHGYRSTACMKIIRDVYGASGVMRWRGVLAIQSVAPERTDWALEGAQYWIDNELVPAGSLTIRRLFNNHNLPGVLAQTGYFGGAPTPFQVTGITKEANPTVTVTQHDYAVEQKLRFNIAEGVGMEQLSWSPSNDVVATITEVVSGTAFKIDINTTSFTTFNSGVASRSTYVVRSDVYDLIEASVAADPDNPYQLFNEQVAEAAITGTCSSGLFTTGASNIEYMRTTEWPDQKVRADQYGFRLEHYEAGNHFTGVLGLTDNPGLNPLGDLLAEYVMAFADSPEVATVFVALYRAFEEIGGYRGAKFSIDGPHTRFGGFGTITKLPTFMYPNGDLVGNLTLDAVQSANKALFKAAA